MRKSFIFFTVIVIIAFAIVTVFHLAVALNNGQTVSEFFLGTNNEYTQNYNSASSSLGNSNNTRAVSAESSLVSTNSYVSILKKDSLSTTTVITPRGEFIAEIAIKRIDQETGLGDRNYLPWNRGMIFVFSNNDEIGFWMKDMKFPLDIVWLNSARKVIGVSANIATSTYPKVFYPSTPVTYVIEMNAGYSKVFGIKQGSVLNFRIN